MCDDVNKYYYCSMNGAFDYTSGARKIAFRYPVLSYIGTQINYWILSFLLLATVIHFNTLMINEISQSIIPVSFRSAVIISMILGMLLGIILGLLDLLVDRSRFNRLTLGTIILIRTITYPFILFGLVSLLQNVIWDLIITPYYPETNEFIESNSAWKYLRIILLIYTTVMGAIISFINQMNKKFGPGILIPMLMGRYRKPRDQERIFMFLDLRSSTHHAERLGHIAYSAMIRDSFMDINHVVSKNNGEIYQYVGDEVVISWRVNEGARKLSCFNFYFDVQDIFHERMGHYEKYFGFVPEFKAGMHIGLVTAVEVGEVKRDIAYHGDILNTTARIQGLCNQYNQDFLVSEAVSRIPEAKASFLFKSLGEVSLRGKDKTVEIFSVRRKVS